MSKLSSDIFSQQKGEETLVLTEKNVNKERGSKGVPLLQEKKLSRFVSKQIQNLRSPCDLEQT